jgi:hypothetical protein
MTIFSAPSLITEAGGVDDLDIRAFKAHDQRHLKADLLDRRDHALGDDVTAHDAAEDVHEDALHVRVRRDDLERLCDLLLRGATAHVEEVRGLRAVELDDVHRGHGKARAVDHAADLAVQRDVVQVMLGRGQFLGVLLRLVAQCCDIGMAVDRVAVEAELGVQNLERAGVGHDQRVDLQHLHVLLDEGFVEDAHECHAFLDLLAFEAQRERDAAAVEGLVAGRGINAEGQDLFGGGGRDLFDVHAALGGAHERDAAGLAIDQKREIQLRSMPEPSSM